MNENEVYDQEDILEDETSDDVYTSSDESSSLEEQLDRVEALLNEDIALRTSEENEDQAESLVEENVTGSGAVEEPNYAQYIYDYLTDSTLKVEIVEAEDPTIFSKSLNDYNVSEGIMVIGLIVALSVIATHFIEKYVFKFRR